MSRESSGLSEILLRNTGGQREARRAKRRGQSAKRIGHGAERTALGADKEVAKERPKFRFLDLEIWQDAMEIAERLFDIADRLEERRLYRFAEQLRGSGLSMSNNIAEGSGSNSKREFSQFLNIARRSTFENANVILVLEKRGLMRGEEVTDLLERLDHLCRKITNFQKSLNA
jgi:four helix bundle protein